ncbi:MAG: hypothetical protein JJT81_06375 [Rubellimicrobium sp.]|nr:hypothetical protein [Rubellimicrobium sp.]
MSGPRIEQEDFDPGAFGPEEDLWFLPGPPEPDEEALFRDDADAAQRLSDWQRAEAGRAADLARVAGRLGALDDRLLRGPAGWRHRLALIEAAELSWTSGDRIGPDRLAQWIALRLAGMQEDAGALARAGWAARRLGGGPGPMAGLAGFLGRHDPEGAGETDDPLLDRARSWVALMQAGGVLHPITRAAMGYHLWALAGLARTEDRIEAAVTAARIATIDLEGAVFAPLAMGGASALRAGGDPADRLGRWIDGMEHAILTAMRQLDRIEAWSTRATQAMAALSGRTPPALREVLSEWPLVSAPMAEALTGASRAAVQRNLTWMQARGLIREVTGQGRFRMWRAAA